MPSLDTLSLRGRLLLRTEALVLDLNGVVKGRTVDDALARVGRGLGVAPAAISRPASRCASACPGGDIVTVYGGGLATSSVGAAALAARRRAPASSDRPGDRPPGADARGAT